jgi:hypothetical protein
VTAPGPIFCCYAHRDAPAVLPLMAALEAAGVPVWRDHLLRFGDHWREAIAAAIADSAGMVVFLGDGGPRPEQVREYSQAFARQVRVIPAMLPGYRPAWPEGPLGMFQALDLRGPGAAARLVRAITTAGR